MSQKVFTIRGVQEGKSTEDILSGVNESGSTIKGGTELRNGYEFGKLSVDSEEIQSIELV